MPYYKSKNVLFIHIPKTGGTVIEDEIKKHCSQTLYSGYRNHVLDFPFNKISLQHQFYQTIYDNRVKLNVDFENLKVFTVVRNPYDRLISDLFWNKMISNETSSEQVYNVIKNNYLNNKKLDNHNVPQYKYITDANCNIFPNIKVFRTEMLNSTNEELNSFLGFSINIQKNNKQCYDKYLNRDTIDLVNEYYKKDFELFDYSFK